MTRLMTPSPEGTGATSAWVDESMGVSIADPASGADRGFDGSSEYSAKAAAVGTTSLKAYVGLHGFRVIWEFYLPEKRT